jgi:hypothetical protein
VCWAGGGQVEVGDELKLLVPSSFVILTFTVGYFVYCIKEMQFNARMNI